MNVCHYLIDNISKHFLRNCNHYFFIFYKDDSVKQKKRDRVLKLKK